MAATVEIVTIGRVTLGGQTHSFPEGTTLTLPADHAAALIAAAHAKPEEKDAPEP